MKIENLTKGKLFKRKENAKDIYVKGEYNRAVKAWECHKWEDINSSITIKKGKLIFDF